MVERIDDMPTGTVGLRASGTLTREDYGDVLEPVPREGVDSGEVRMLADLRVADGHDRDGARIPADGAQDAARNQATG